MTFGFKIEGMPDNMRLRWIAMKNGVLKCTIKYPEYSIEIVKSPRQRSILVIVVFCYAHPSR